MKKILDSSNKQNADFDFRQYNNLTGNPRRNTINKIAIVFLLFFVAQMLIVLFFAVVTSTGISDEHASIMAGIGEVVVGLLAAIAVVHQLNEGKLADMRLRDIEEARFILEFNQAFIQDNNMCKIEHALEKYMEGKTDNIDIEGENRQLLINYLVYLESMAVLVLRGVLTLERIDDLMAYRFFVAINNEIVQKEELFRYPGYYRGCFKLSEHWSRYRKNKNYEILMEETSLDKWLYYDSYIESPVSVRPMRQDDDMDKIAELIYKTDDYIYPAAFGTAKNLKKFLSIAIKQRGGIFSLENIKIALLNDKIVGIAIVLSEPITSKMDCSRISSLSKNIPDSFIHTYKNYFEKIEDTAGYEKEDYLLCLSVDSRYRGLHIGRRLLKQIIIGSNDKNVNLDVIINNLSAVKLYKNCGFSVVDELTGYAYSGEPPVCYTMTYKK